MIGIVFSRLDPSGSNIIEHMINSYDFAQVEGSENLKYENDGVKIFEVQGHAVEADFADSFGCDLILFPHRHKSEAGVGAFTTHSLGNWRNESKVGGKPKQLSYAAPIAMLSALTYLNKISVEVEKTYEATHHGPLLKTPSLFVELGGNEEVIHSKERAAKVGDAVYSTINAIKNNEIDCKKVVVGVGSNHYPEKFTALALERGYAFSHIMPKYAIMNEDGTNNLDVLEQTLERSTHKPEVAVIEWKSLNSATREETIKKLNEIGLDYEKI